MVTQAPVAVLVPLAVVGFVAGIGAGQVVSGLLSFVGAAGFALQGDVAPVLVAVIGGPSSPVSAAAGNSPTTSRTGR